jgi:hypothetical protein
MIFDFRWFDITHHRFWILRRRRMEKIIWIGSLSGPNLKSKKVVPKTALIYTAEAEVPLS